MVYFIIVAIGFIFLLIAICRNYNRRKVRIESKDGIQQNIFVEIGGIEQYLQIRGNNIQNPIILFLHGGPCNPYSSIAPNYQSNIEKHYILVNWDQRGCGRTFIKNYKKRNEIRVDKELLISDINEIVKYLKKRFNKKKIILMGHSWGTIIGIEYIKRYPEDIESYIGIAQSINTIRSEENTVNIARKNAREDGNIRYIKKLEKIWDEIKNKKEVNIEYMKKFIKMRELLNKYIRDCMQISIFEMFWRNITSHEFSFAEIKYFFIKNNLKNRIKYTKELDEYAFIRFNLMETVHEYEIPIYFISGENDTIPSIHTINEYYDLVEAPKKEYKIIKGSGHLPYIDNPEEFQKNVISLLKK